MGSFVVYSFWQSMVNNENIHGIFFRLEVFGFVAGSRKNGRNTVSKVVNESMRLPGFCDHVAQPQDPIIVYGKAPDKLMDALLKRDRPKVPYVHKRSKKCLMRLQRSDHPVLAVGVLSVPPDWKKKDLLWSQLKLESIQWLIYTFGIDRVGGVVEHLDEKCPHLHIFILPLEGEDICDVHPGFKAVGELATDSLPMVRKDAFKEAMKKMLDSFHQIVGQKYELSRKHIGATRFTRAKWHVWRWYQDRAEREEKQTTLQKQLPSDVPTDVLENLEIASIPVSPPEKIPQWEIENQFFTSNQMHLVHPQTSQIESEDISFAQSDSQEDLSEGYIPTERPCM